MEFVIHELREGSYFFGDIKKEGILLFTTNRYQLADKREMSPAEIQAKAQRDFENWFESADRFLVAFKSMMDNSFFKEAAFQLHQVTERFYGAIQLVFTGYKPKTHDIEDLGALAKACDIEFDKAFQKAAKRNVIALSFLKKRT